MILKSFEIEFILQVVSEKSSFLQSSAFSPCASLSRETTGCSENIARSLYLHRFSQISLQCPIEKRKNLAHSEDDVRVYSWKCTQCGTFFYNSRQSQPLNRAIFSEHPVCVLQYLFICQRDKKQVPQRAISAQRVNTLIAGRSCKLTDGQSNLQNSK